jgi:hypothetical protein
MNESKYFFFPMSSENITLINAGKKWTTLRNDWSADKIGMKKGDVGWTKFAGMKYEVMCLGEAHISAVGYDEIWESEGFNHTILKGPKFNSTKKWLHGKGSLWIYQFRRIEG